MPDQFLHGIETVQIDDGIRPIRTARSSVIGIVGTAPDADEAAFPYDKPILITGPRMAATLGAAGTLLDAYNAAYAQGVNMMVIVRVEEGADAPETLAAVAGSAADQTGAFALLLANNLTGQTPRLLGAPGFTAPSGGVASPVTANLLIVATRTRAIVVADGPNTTEAEAILSRESYGSDRLYIVDPAVSVFDTVTAAYVIRPASAFVLGVISRMDNDKGFWWSPSNQLIAGIAGTARPITFAISSAETEATLFYLDPPYWGCETDYGKEMFSRDDFARMAAVLHGVKGRFILSINDVPEIRKLFDWAQLTEVTTSYTVGNKTDRAPMRAELLISNFAVG